jgi:hypothetical protein
VDTLSTSPPQSDQLRHFSTIPATSPAGESVSPKASVCGFVPLNGQIPGLFLEPHGKFVVIALLFWSDSRRGVVALAPYRQQIDVNADQLLGMGIAEAESGDRAPVANRWRRFLFIALSHLLHQSPLPSRVSEMRGSGCGRNSKGFRRPGVRCCGARRHLAEA